MSSVRRPAIYLAGPAIFFPDSQLRADAMRVVCDAHGAEGLYPADETVALDGDPFAVSMRIFAKDRALIERADAVVADFTPFRGISADVGTVWEAGYAAGLGKPVAAFTRESRLYHDREDAACEGTMTTRLPIADNVMLTGAIVWANPHHAESLAQNGGLCSQFEQALRMVLEALRRLPGGSD